MNFEFHGFIAWEQNINFVKSLFDFKESYS